MTERSNRRASVRRILWWVFGANLVVALVKLGIGIRSGSIAVLGIAAESGMDALNNGVALLAARVASVPPDEEHPYGHGKFETLGALAVASFLSVTTFELVRGGVHRLLAGAPPPQLDRFTFLGLCAVMAVSGVISWYEFRAGRRLGSELLRADARHTLADVLATAAVLGGLGLVALGWRGGDAWVAFGVAGMVGYSGYQILRDAVPVLVDRRALEARKIRAYVETTPGVRKATEIRSRGRMGDAFAELTIHVDPGRNVEEAHRVADAVEEKLEEEGFAGVVVHVEPADRGERPGTRGASPS